MSPHDDSVRMSQELAAQLRLIHLLAQRRSSSGGPSSRLDRRAIRMVLKRPAPLGAEYLRGLLATMFEPSQVVSLDRTIGDCESPHSPESPDGPTQTITDLSISPIARGESLVDVTAASTWGAHRTGRCAVLPAVSREAYRAVHEASRSSRCATSSLVGVY
jgi:hypothetical protein